MLRMRVVMMARAGAEDHPSGTGDGSGDREHGTPLRKGRRNAGSAAAGKRLGDRRGGAGPGLDAADGPMNRGAWGERGGG